MQQEGWGQRAIVAQPRGISPDISADSSRNGQRQAIGARAVQAKGMNHGPVKRQLIFGAQQLIDLDRRNIGDSLTKILLLIVIRQQRRIHGLRNQILEFCRNPIEA